MTEKPTHQQLIDLDGLESVHREADDSFRHGAYIYQVFRRVADDTYWSVNYALSTDAETNELREGICDINEVRAVKKTVIVYKSAPDTPQGDGDE